MDITTLQIVWFVLIAVLWTGFLLLEGFDYGVAMLIPFLGRTEKEKRVIVNTIGPVWDGNEVWLLTAGGAMFAAFPAWYATLFSGLYLPLFLVLVGLIIRGVSFEYRAKRPETKWRRTFDWCAAIGSFVVALVLGVAFANFLIGLPVTPLPAVTAQATTAVFMLTPAPYLLQLFSPFGLLGGVVLVVLFLFHGSIYLTVKTRGVVQDRARAFATVIGLVAIVGGALFLVLQNTVIHPTGWIGWGLLVVAAAGLVIGWWFVGRGGRPGLALTGTGVSIIAVAAGIFTAMFPNLGFVNAPGAAMQLNIATAASQDSTLTIMLIAAVIFVPIVLGYTAWTYWVFRRPLSVDNIPDDEPAPAHAG
ncbi:MAG: cytochrome d ubiquinol oxidase subunit II [Propionicimonas sp.]|uniref:cytochrome d ubiquinol oxidase subunit II n=1 Tax=Propionicimonas sp. TaxID=1955623 RepID=UPI002B2054AF|nr:cytochrome d ubiquinol oxidase subunit II [Propionicimonas sp.]MEA4943416.1 cytochrome d ubiquinol oxidase subunit II [Propionicimonas sp.]MEA5051866.1 cytochrome d ubiquinol oxidase subunit II [Propionicimonas sp.]MEA5117943.1 cytochrome d ubiquinol oxidase subunit II [Propionicimonas sp.]